MNGKELIKGKIDNQRENKETTQSNVKQEKTCDHKPA